MTYEDAMQDTDRTDHATLMRELKAHGVEAKSEDGQLWGLSEFTRNGGPLETEWERIEDTPAAVLAWLGY